MSARRLLAGVGVMVLFAVVLGTAVVGAAVGLVSGSPLTGVPAALGAPAPGEAGGDLPVVPDDMLGLYRSAAATCPGLPAAVLGAIGTVESANGTSSAPGVQSGANAAGAEGPMQFLPATFAEYDEPVPPGGADPPSPYDPVDAVYAAARLLCANGAADGVDLPAAVFAYNHSRRYVTDVLDLAARIEAAGL